MRHVTRDGTTHAWCGAELKPEDKPVPLWWAQDAIEQKLLLQPCKACMRSVTDEQAS